MPGLDDALAPERPRPSFAEVADIEEFVTTLERYERGELTPDQWRAFRLVRGTYGQRQSGDAQMLRVKIPQGILDPDQLRAIADVADLYSRGFGHVTTRQNIQLHFMKLHDVEKAMRRLAEAGLTTREACGNSVRNVTACPFAGVAAEEAFDVTPYADALTRYLLRHPLSSTLPRKFKIAFEGCPQDHALAAINDLGFRARLQVNGSARPGFRVTAGGGTAILCASGGPLFDFLPAEEILGVAEAVLRVFHRLGDHKHRQRNRMKFLIKTLGWDAWRAAFERAWDDVRREGTPQLPFDPHFPPEQDAPRGPRPAPPSPLDVKTRADAATLRGPGLVPETRRTLAVLGPEASRWTTTNVRPQKQAGYSVVLVTLPLGDVTAAQLRLLGELALAYGDGTVRTTLDQDLAMRWVPTASVRELHRLLAAAGLDVPGSGTAANVTSCPGAEACRLAVTQSRGLGRILGDHLRQREGLVSAGGDLSIKISGCPNGCGQHHVAGLGFQGSVKRLGSKIVPQYFVMLGGGVDAAGTAHFGRLAAKVPARRITEVVSRLIALYHAESEPGEEAATFFRRVEVPRVKALLRDLEALTAEDALPEDFVDLGEDHEFRVEALEGECSA
jgi:sulfite reductase (NADPH) hemoprotein beta-component